MNGYARDLDTFNDFDEPEYMPVVGDRVLIALDEPEKEGIGTITEVCDNGYGDFSYVVSLDGSTSVEALGESILEVYA